jgi:hypothetical protein
MKDQKSFTQLAQKSFCLLESWNPDTEEWEEIPEEFPSIGRALMAMAVMTELDQRELLAA